MLTIPREIPPDQYAVLVWEFCQQQFVSKDMIADFAIHDPHPPGHKLDDDNVYRKLQGHWIIEMSEMMATANAKSIEEIKSFLSRQKEVYKIPYETHPATDSGNPSEKTMDGFVEVTEQMELPF